MLGRMKATLDGSRFGPDQPCFGCAPDHPFGFRLRFEQEAHAVTTRFTPDARYQGPPGIMHGGLVSTLADEIGAWTIIALLEKFGFTAKLSGTLTRPIRIGREVRGRGVIARPGTRVVTVGVELEQDGEAAYSGELKFVILDAQGAERLLGAPLPPQWLDFGR